MPLIDVKEIAPQNWSERKRRLQRIKRSLERNKYEVNSDLVASGILHEAWDNVASHRLADD
ncbi:MAG: hypothetical protein WC828_00390 [Thermoleophilia bacterium]|jgi:hypothetical protein